MKKHRSALERAERHVLLASWEMWAWVIFTIPYSLIPALRESLWLVGILSVYALVLTAKGNKRAAEAEVAGYANPGPDE